MSSGGSDFRGCVANETHFEGVDMANIALARRMGKAAIIRLGRHFDEAVAGLVVDLKVGMLDCLTFGQRRLPFLGDQKCRSYFRYVRWKVQPVGLETRVGYEETEAHTHCGERRLHGERCGRSSRYRLVLLLCTSFYCGVVIFL